MVMENTVSSALDFSAISTALTTAVTPAQIITIIAGIIGVGMTFVLMWFGVRKLVSIFKKAVTKGKISV